MTKPVGALTADYGAQEAAMQAYCAEGAARAMALGNRGPIRFTDDGALHPEIVQAYGRCGFYVFTSVLGAQELADIEGDFLEIRSRLPTHRGRALALPALFPPPPLSPGCPVRK